MSGPEPKLLRCESCGRGVHPDEALHDETTDTILCPRCYDDKMVNYAEIQQERLNEDFHDGGRESSNEECTREHRSWSVPLRSRHHRHRPLVVH